MPATIVLEHLTGFPPGTAATITRARFRSSDADLQDESGWITPPPAGTATNLSGYVNPDVAPQTVQVSSSARFSPGQFLLTDAGTDQQEVVAILAIPDATHIDAIFRKQHDIGDSLALVVASMSKVFRLNIKQIPAAGQVANIRFRQRNPLSAGVNDQYRLVSVYAQGVSDPFASDATHAYNKVPAQEEPFRPIVAGPFQTSGPVIPMVEVQWLFVATVGTVDSSGYVFEWDESSPSESTLSAPVRDW